MNKNIFLIFIINLNLNSSELSHQATTPKPGNSGNWVAIMRHGEADHNLRRVANSNPQSPKYFQSNLTQEGVDKVKGSAHKLREKRQFNKDSVEQTYTSPLPRTQQTTEILVEEGVSSPKRIIVDERLIEIQMGDREGEAHKALTDSWDHSDFESYNGESPELVKERIKSFFEDFIKRVKDKQSSLDPKNRYIIVTHGTPAKELIQILTGKELRLRPGQAKVYPINHALSVREEKQGE